MSEPIPPAVRRAAITEAVDRMDFRAVCWLRRNLYDAYVDWARDPSNESSEIYVARSQAIVRRALTGEGA